MRTTTRLLFIFVGISFCSLSTPTLFAQKSDSNNAMLLDTLITTSEVSKKTGYVMLKRDTLFPIQTRLGPYTPRERAFTLSERLKKLATKSNITVDSFIVTRVDEFSVISYKGQLLLYVNPPEAALIGKPSEEVANGYNEILKTSFTNLLESRKVTYWLTKIGFTLLTLLGLIIIFGLLNRAYRWVNIKLIRYEQGIKRKRKSFLRYLLPKNTSNVFLLLSKVVRIALIVLILILYLPLLFSFLPWTAGLVDKFYGYLAVPVRDVLNGLVQFLPNLFYIFVIIVIARYVIRIVTFVSKEIEDDKLKIKGFHRDWARPTFNILKIILYAFTLVFIFPYLPGSDSPAFKGVSIFLGVLFSLGSTSAIANIVAGIVITYMRPFVIGDRVKIGDSMGDIIEKNLLITRMRTIKNEDITIPNATIINTHLWNFSKYAHDLGIILHPTVTIGYDVPSELVTRLLLQAAQHTKNLTRELKPFVLQKSLSDFYVEYELNVYTKQPKKMAYFYSELNKSILSEFNQAGVEILSPHYSAFRDGNASTIPTDTASTPPPPTNPVEQIIDKVTGK